VDVAAIESIIQMLALLNAVYLIMTIIPKRLAGSLDRLFLVVFTSIQPLVLIMLAAKYGMTQYVWVEAGVVLALFAYGAVPAERSS
jgi:hypothetical protein